jgi:hypothetical protein
MNWKSECNVLRSLVRTASVLARMDGGLTGQPEHFMDAGIT